MEAFEGFPKQTFELLRGLRKNNSKEWFDRHRDDYDADYVEPARRFVEAIGPKLRALSRTVRYEPKVNGSIFRIQRDTRFSKDKTPYKTHLDLWFWEGEKRGWDTPGFFLRLTPESVMAGAGMHQLARAALDRYRRAVLDDRSGNALVKLLEKVRAAGYAIGGATRKTVPRGLDPAHPRATLLLHEALHAGLEMPLPESVHTAGFVAECLRHFRATAPVSRWLLEHVVGSEGRAER